MRLMFISNLIKFVLCVVFLVLLYLGYINDNIG